VIRRDFVYAVHAIQDITCRSYPVDLVALGEENDFRAAMRGHSAHENVGHRWRHRLRLPCRRSNRFDWWLPRRTPEEFMRRFLRDRLALQTLHQFTGRTRRARRGGALRVRNARSDLSRRHGRNHERQAHRTLQKSTMHCQIGHRANFQTKSGDIMPPFRHLATGRLWI